MSVKRREQDDGYRGLVRNPETGRVFRANATTSRRTDLERITSEDDAPIVEVSKPKEPVVTEEVEAEVEGNATEAEQALEDIVKAALASDDKAELKALGAQIGVKVTNTMNVETMHDRIAKQAAAISAAA